MGEKYEVDRGGDGGEGLEEVCLKALIPAAVEQNAAVIDFEKIAEWILGMHPADRGHAYDGPHAAGCLGDLA
eukprot:SAG25_NODE_343_length_9443_cov_3.590218_5_plen_72_part_00